MEHVTIDIGASSGKILSGKLVDGRLECQVVYRFPNGYAEKDGHLVWDVDGLFHQTLLGLQEARRQGINPSTIAIDTWGCDYVLLDEQGMRVGDAIAYRDHRTEHVGCPISWPELYRRCGIQHLSFNTIYQLLALKAEHPEQLDQAFHLLMIPDYLAWRLTEVMHQEYTNATTTSLVDAQARNWDMGIIARLGLPGRLFKPLVQPGTVYGPLSKAVEKVTGMQSTVIAAPSHDTASAVLGSPLRPGSAFLSSGTWSLLGTVADRPYLGGDAIRENFTNEGGYRGTIRLLRNLMGTWMLQRIRKEWDDTLSFPDLADAARTSGGFPSVVDIEDERFLAPESMVGQVRSACKESGQPVPESLGELARCIYHSLAVGYRKAIGRLARITGKDFTHLAIVGGGSKDQYLCQLTADETGLEVTAGPDEGTAYGNLLCQMIECGEIRDMAEAGNILRNSIDTKTYRRNQK